MEKEPIQVFEPLRLLWGDFPWTFGFEIALRSAVMFIFLLFVMRITGKRALTQMSPFEFSLLIALGSAVGDPMFYEDVPLLHGLIVISVVVAILKLLERVTQDSKKLERVLEGKAICLVKDGIVNIDKIKEEEISTDELFMKLREKGVRNLGLVERVYLEVSGNISIFCYDEEKVGLDILPLDGDTLSERKNTIDNSFSCTKCGYTKQSDINNLDSCALCQSLVWVPSMKAKPDKVSN